ncbi:MAG: tRNA lysidine(34) synthetase TilS [Cyanobacteria bacterium P01_F01_bin.153]
METGPEPKLRWTNWHGRLHGTLRASQLLPAKCRIAIACSGGQDSLLLAQLLLDLQLKWHWNLHLIHCDHQWRTDSGDNAKFVSTWAKSKNLPATVCEFSASASPGKSPSRTEAAARQWRYGQLQEIAQQEHCDYLVTGHTATDRAETLLFNLVRGSGSRGLGSLVSQRLLAPTLQLVRPMLDWTRADTAKGCQELNLHPWEDSSNNDLSYSRNRMRGEVLPLLKQHFNPQAESVLARTADLLQVESDYLDQCAEKILQDAAADRHTPPRQLHRHLLAELPLALQRRSLYLWLNQHCPKTVTFLAIESVVPLITAPNRTQTAPFPGGSTVQVRHNALLWIPPSA